MRFVGIHKASINPALNRISAIWRFKHRNAIVFLRSDTAATIYFAARFVRLLLEGGVYFFGMPGDINDGWMRSVRVRR